MSIYQAITAIKQAEKEFCSNYVKNASSRKRNSKFWSGGSEEWWDSKEHIAVLNKFGYKDSDEYNAVYEATPEYVSYKKFDTVFGMLPHNSSERNAVISALKDNGLWDEECHHLEGILMWEILKQHAPKQVQFFELSVDLGYTMINFGNTIQLSKD